MNAFELWNGYAASIPGAGHIRKGIPCQDASAVILDKHPALIVCDGRGSASHSHFGAQGAVKAFQNQIAVFEPMLASILDAEQAEPERWEMFARILYRTFWQVQLALTKEYEKSEPKCEPKWFDFTVACAIVGKNHIGCFQVGDGSIVLRQNGVCQTAFQLDKGEYANQTLFLREGGEQKGRFHSKLFPATENTGIAITSDGPEHLMFNLATMTPGPVFPAMFDALVQNELEKQDIMDYLTRSEWNNDPRGTDDRSLVLLASCLPVAEESPAEKETEEKTQKMEETVMKNNGPSAKTITAQCNTYINPDKIPGVVVSYQNIKLKATLVFLVGCITALLLGCAWGAWQWKQQQESAAAELQQASERLQQMTGELAVLEKKINELKQEKQSSAIRENDALQRLKASEQKCRDWQQKLEEQKRVNRRILQKDQVKSAAPIPSK